MTLKWVPRDQWTRLPKGPILPLHAPVRFVFFGYTRKDYSSPRSKQSPGPNPSYEETQKELDFLVRGDTWKLPDIRYNFLVGSSGEIYEGRGWNNIPSLPSKYYRLNFYSIYLTFVGDYTSAPPSKTMFQARNDILKYGVENKMIHPKFLMVTLPLPPVTNYDLNKVTLAN